uniref:Uncharacterized protein n=1 Tax=Glossina morsitans morsitans TaxID=37546 RepID=A0A1B0G806_GLOMM
MLKWSVSAQKLLQESVNISNASHTPCLRRKTKQQCKRRATIANRTPEDMPQFTSTPMMQRSRNSRLPLTPLADALSTTPELQRQRQAVAGEKITSVKLTRSHSTRYATTLPRFEEEYSPTTVVMPSGQELALRGLLLDPFIAKTRYLSSPDLREEQTIANISNKREHEDESSALAEEKVMEESTGLNSSKMSDHTLDKLIDAILDSARKDEKKKKSRKSFSLRRRTLLKSQTDINSEKLSLSPSYTAGYDPANELSFSTLKSPAAHVLTSSSLSPSPVKATFSEKALPHLPTSTKKRNPFIADTEAQPTLKRRTESYNLRTNGKKRYRAASPNYLEIGVALPSIYV